MQLREKRLQKIFDYAIIIKIIKFIDSRRKEMKKIVAITLTLAILIASLSSLTACGDDSKTLHVLIWGDYMNPDIITQFEKQTGYKVKSQTLTSNEEMLIKLSSPDCIYDVCFPSDYVIEKLIANDMLAELNKDNIPNLRNIDERFLEISNQFDPGNKYSVPYMWGTVGIVYNTEMVKEPVDSWSILWNEEYAGQVLMYDSMRDSIGITLLKLGYDINTRNPDEVEEARDELIAQQGIRKGFFDDDIKNMMIGNQGALAVVYSGDAMLCIDEENGNPNLAYAVPKEGSNVWFDNIIIPKTSTKKAMAEKFIDFLCDAEVAKANTEYIGYSTPNKAALELMDESWTGNYVYNPSQDVLDRCSIFRDLGDFLSVFEEAWNKVYFEN